MEIGHLWNVRRQILLVFGIQVTDRAMANQPKWRQQVTRPPDNTAQCNPSKQNFIRDGIGRYSAPLTVNPKSNLETVNKADEMN